MNQLAIVTGASRGVGKEVAHYFAEKGFDLALIAKNDSLLQALSIDLINKYAVNAICYVLDIREYSSVYNCIQNLMHKYQSIDVLFNSAGILFRGTSGISPVEFNHMLDVNLRGIYNLTHCVVPFMKKQRSGYIFNLVSYAAKRPLADSGGYCMSKYGVLGYSQSLGLELIGDGIKVTAICPSVIHTDMTRDMANFPNEEKISCQDIVNTVAYLMRLSPNAYVDEVIVKSTFLLRQSK